MKRPRPEALGEDVVHVLEGARGRLHGVATLVRKADELGATVCGVRPPLEIAQLFEVDDKLRHRLLGDGGQLSQLGEAKAFVGHMRHDVVMDNAMIVKTGGHEVLLHRVGQMSRSQDEKQQERGVLVRVGHHTMLVRGLDESGDMAR